MEEIKILYSEPREAEYKTIKVFNDLDEYLKVYNDGKDFKRVGYEHWKVLNKGNNHYYSYSGGDYIYHTNYDDLFLTEECYRKLLNNCKRSFKIYERDLFRTQRDSNCRVSKEFSTIDGVLKYMKEDSGSWIPEVVKEIDEDIDAVNKKIKELQNKITILEEDKTKIQDEEYLKSNVKTEYEFDSLYYKSMNKIGRAHV